MTHNKSRRRLLGGLALAPVAMALPAAAAGHPDAHIIALARQHAIAQAAMKRAYERADAVNSLAEAQLPRKPEALVIRPGDYFASSRGVDAGKHFNADQVRRWREALAKQGSLALTATAGAAFTERGREVVAAWDAHRDAAEAVYVATGYRHAQAIAEAADRIHFDLEQQIFATAATTPEGWRVKARIAAEIIGDSDETYEDQLTRSLITDLLAVPDAG